MRASDVQREIDRMAGKYEQDDGALTKDQIDQIRGDPVAVVRWNDIGHISWRTHVMLSDDTPLYTAPPQRKPLTDEQIADLYFDKFSMGELKAFARAIEAAHGIKGEA